MKEQMKKIDCKNLKILGDLCRRIDLNYARMESKHYRPEHIFSADKSGWPGDWEGRTILALVKLQAITGREPAYLRRIIELLPYKLNAKGYLGPAYNGNSRTATPIFDEQQLSGHNWLLRGLLEYYLLTKDQGIKTIAQDILENLYLPLAGYINGYPSDPNERSGGGRYDGTISGQVRNWRISTDVGCAFISLDAISQACLIFDEEPYYELADEMIGALTRIDLLSVKMQTHATLSALRGILRMYEADGNETYLKTAIEIFETYIRHGMTENYANINWFGRPDTWTEPCAIIDSYICAMELYKFTLEYRYLKLANRIYRNAICYAQRLNGGFGCDTCAAGTNKLLRPHAKGLNEAFWCCTMRGAEGLSYIAQNTVFYSVDYKQELQRVYVNNLEEIIIRSAFFDLEVHPEYPNRGVIGLRCANKTSHGIELVVYNPVEDEPFTVSVNPGILDFRIRFDIKPVFDGKRFLHGDAVLGIKGICQGEEIDAPDLEQLEYIGNGMYKYKGTSYVLEPLTDMADQEFEETIQESRQVTF